MSKEYLKTVPLIIGDVYHRRYFLLTISYVVKLNGGDYNGLIVMIDDLSLPPMYYKS